MQSYLEFISQVLGQASKIALSKFGKVSSSIKPEDNNQVLTEADLAIGWFIVEEIKKTFPEHNIIDEEQGTIDKRSEYTWVIDPIDGTSNFAAGLPMYGIIIGLLKANRPIAGGVALPAFNEVYVAEKGKGAFCNNQKLDLSLVKPGAVSLVSYGIDGRKEDPEFTKKEGRIIAEVALKFTNIRSSNSVFDTMMVARGKYIGDLNQGTKIWDNVGAQVILEEAGAVYTDFFGAPVDYSNPLSKERKFYTYCTASSLVHKKLQKIIHKIIGD